MTRDAQGRVLIGNVTCPSGIVLVIDFGALHLWSHDRAPDDQELRDFRIVGPQAEAAGRALGEQWHPHFLYDNDAEGIAHAQQKLAQLQMQAQIVPDHRHPHRRRVDYALQMGRGAGEVQFYAMSGVAVAGLPAGHPLPVWGTPLGPNDERWRKVELDVYPQLQVAQRQQAGDLVIDCARFMFGDVNAIGAWNHERAADGQADFLFWGLNAEEVARHYQAPPQGDGQFGWKNMPEQQAFALDEQLQQLKAQHGLRFATDVRPHSHHYYMLERCRAAPTQSGVLEVGGASLCGILSPTGDGTFPVSRELDAAGHLVRVVIELSAG